MHRIVYVKKEDCTSCNQCADSLPSYFRMDDHDTAESHVKNSSINAAPVPESDWKAVQTEMDECPGECIKWKE
ncbi:MAG TPA: ferredoxin [Leptospiraceae bacterium]|nr:ferredoxin [Leptospirales bacterium]HMU84576.1 ferredoxin [Leptospiraceae bacterium]HMW61851.1 ferredoxin [Leptospiraceae bacterium]HMX58554.1 ferredoxin [Leptospiraceae bacterium]HMY46598.1 ferredoxin [Leptospiraceae bacterium]